MLYLLTCFSFLFSSNLYFEADPFYLFYYEYEQFNQNDYDINLDIRPAFKSKYNDNMSLSYNAWYYYSDNAPNLENTSNKYVGKGSSFYNSLHFDYFNDYILFSIEPYVHTSENLYFVNQHSDPMFQALNDGPSDKDRPYVDYGIRETQFILQKDSYGVGFSNTNMWWGPGTHNSLHLSNNASGFNYFFLGTTSEKRVKSFGYNFKYVFSKLDKNITEPYFTGLAGNFTYYGNQITTFGFFRSFLSGGFLNDDISITKAMLLPFQTFFKEELTAQNNNIYAQDASDQTLSLFVSSLFPKHNFKIYFEYGWNDHRWDIYDFFQHPDHSAASMLGFRKYGLFDKDEFILGFEYTNLIKGRFENRTGNSNWFDKEFYDYSKYDGRRYSAHIGGDADDVLVYFGYLSKLTDVIFSFNYERHGVMRSVELTEETDLFHVPEYKVELKIDLRKKFKDYNLYFIYEYEFLDNLGIPIQGINPRFNLPTRTSNVFGIGISKVF